MKINFNALPRLRKNQKPLTDAESTAWLESLMLEADPEFLCDEDSVEDFVASLVTDIMPHQSLLAPPYAIAINRWVKPEHAHLVADWVILHGKNGVALLDSFVRINTPESLLQLQMIAYSHTESMLVMSASQLLEEAALARGLRVWELQNLIVPTCGMSITEPWLIDYGSQRFGIRLNADLGVILVSESRRVLRELPEPTNQDDAHKVIVAQAMFKQVLADLEDTIPTQMMRFETALVEQLRWGGAHWRSFVLGHPLLLQLAQRLLWSVHTQTGRCVGSFRVGDDYGLCDSNDEPFQLSEDACVGVLHPLDITKEERDAWGVILGDYELPTLFPQMDRPIFQCAPEDRKSTTIVRPVNREMEWSRTHLLSRGWQVEDASERFFRSFRTADIQVMLRGAVNDGTLVEMSVSFDRFLGHPHHTFALRDVPKIVFSEVSLELESLIHSKA